MKLYVGNLPFSATETEIRDMFEAYGTITDIHLPVDRETGRPRGFGFVTFADHDAATAALNGLNGNDFGGRQLRISEAVQRPGGPAPRGGGGGGGRPPGRSGGGGRDRGRKDFREYR
jgi:RNA recognition motif-containing protein